MSFTEWMACIRPITPVLFVGFCDGPCALTRVDESRSDTAMTERTRIRDFLRGGEDTIFFLLKSTGIHWTLYGDLFPGIAFFE